METALMLTVAGENIPLRISLRLDPDETVLGTVHRFTFAGRAYEPTGGHHHDAAMVSRIDRPDHRHSITITCLHAAQWPRRKRSRRSRRRSGGVPMNSVLHLVHLQDRGEASR